MMDNDWFFDNFDHDTFEKRFSLAWTLGLVVWVVSVVLSVALTVAVIWGLVELVQWVTSK